ncbi:uncharacterized protein [Physcomitrium patens]|uniref:DUF547 domain-containing protein n=1 Tax=Physcomitrium patens TaxID=3218 RepID=A0A7I4B727_PHYPA|nr:uncharacterized protein LOC112294009 isoform X2 [Physcomitrium patens]|eukprot:XP_024399848.1 uncharacterized protein LOC112294009 isoform X2 [Physcomitrella patens]
MRNEGLIAKEQVLKKQEGGPSAANLRHVKKYISEARPLEDGIDEVALRKLVKSSSFKKFVQRLELENEVVELHKQLDQEVKLRSALERAVSHSSNIQMRDFVLDDLPNNVQRLLTDITMLEVAVQRLETQAAALQWELVHEQTECAALSHTSNSPLDVPPHSGVTKSVIAMPTSVRSVDGVTESSARSEVPPPCVISSSRATSSGPATLKELLRKPAPEPEQKLHVPPKSPRHSLRSFWSSLDGQSQSSVLPLSKKDRTRTASPTTSERNRRSSPDFKTCIPSSVTVPSNFSLSTSWSPITPGEEARNTTRITPSDQSDLPVARKSLNPVKFLPSAKRLAFWNFSSFSEDRSAKPTAETEPYSISLPRECSPKLGEDFTDDARMRKLRRSWGIKRSDQSQSPRSPLDNAITASSTPSTSNRSDSCVESARKSFTESPRRSTDKLELPKGGNRLSEEMVRCMTDIYCHLAEPSSESHASQKCLVSSSTLDPLSPSSSPSSQSNSSLAPEARSPDLNLGLFAEVIGCDSTPDPYKEMGKLQWADIGPYTYAHDVPWLSVKKDQLEYVALSLGRFKLLVEQLANVDPTVMSHDQKLAFWINLYNSLLMHAFLAYGIPRSDLKFFDLMQKATYCVGGHWFNAATIECHLLKAKIMSHRPQFPSTMVLHDKKLTEEQSKHGIDKANFKVNFALSCGGYSSPMVRVYTPEHIHDELDCAFQDYLQATVGLTTKGRVVLSKLVYNYAREFVEDDALLEWVCRFLPVAQVAAIYECAQLRYRSRIFSNPVTFVVSPYSFAFRYLFPKPFSGAAGFTTSDFFLSST